MKIAKVTSREDGTLHVVAEDGRFGTFDVRPYLESQAFLPLKDWAEFSQVRNGGYYIEGRRTKSEVRRMVENNGVGIVTLALTGDRHFEQAGFEALLA